MPLNPETSEKFFEEHLLRAEKILLAKGLKVK